MIPGFIYTGIGRKLETANYTMNEEEYLALITGNNYFLTQTRSFAQTPLKSFECLHR
jgi:hypothetical protein